MGDARVVLTTLINENLLTPGPKKLYVSYYRKRVYADLLSDGSIRFKDQVYTSPVPCALHMKRTLNPSLKSDAGWSSMYSTTSGKSLKDIKDRLNLHKRGTNARSIQKDKKAATSLSLSSSSTVNDRVGQVVAATIKNKKCTACKEEATSDVAECSACHSKTHWKCASPVLEAAPLTSWFCEKCLTGQADRILEFLQQTRRVLVERIAEQKEAEDTAKDKKALAATETIEEKEHEVKEDKTATLIEVVKEEDDRSAKNDEKSLSEDKITKDVAEAEVDSVVVVSEDKEPEDGNCDGASVTAGSSSGPPTEPIVASKTMASEVVEDEGGTPGDEQKDTTPDALEEKERKHEDLDPTTDVAGAKERETLSSKNQDNVTEDENIDSQQFIITEITQTPSAEEQLLVLIDGLIAEVSSKNDRTNLIANTTGAMLVHLEKTQLVQLMDYGKREILAAIQPESEEDKEQEGGDAEDDQDGSASCNNSEVGSLIKIFDLRHQILSSQSQFERTTSTLAKRTQIDICNAETRIMELEEFRTLETRAITKVVDLVNQYSNDLEECKQKKYYNEMLLESINHRRSFIRSRNINDCFVPSYRYCTKRMTTSSDQLLMTVLLEKLRDITKSVNEWTKMERHFTKMTLNLKKSLSFIGTKRKRADDVVKLLPSSASFTKFKLPPSRRLIERQIANCEANLNSIRQERVQMSRTLFGVLRIAREEQFSKEIIRMIDILYRKCRDIKAEEEEEQSRLKEEAEIVAKASEEENAVRGRENIEDSEAKKPEIETQCVDEASNACDSSSASHTNSAAAVAINVTLSSEMKGISSLLRSEDSDAKDPSYNSADTKSQADNDEDSEGDLEQASRAIADITSSVLPDIGRGDSRTELLNASLLTETPGENSLQVFTSPSQFMIRGERGNSDTRDALAHQSIAQHQNLSATRPTGRNQQSFLDQALDVLNKATAPRAPAAS
ncbi:unnamed protein product [Peronospora belbahrii]|uniref:PHD-type domain-containing protein n=1 Tax=Peronospora belbahrii TaxID=622444 RepID=A0ABN8CM70_9STRA|nr:unnamed protein product [Peronospora belbahrii]